MIDWSGIVLHHSAGPDTPSQDAEAIERWHVEGRGWAAIAYHYLVELVGDAYLVVKGRPETMQGSHARGRNRTHLGVCLVGDFSVDAPPIAQLAVASELCAELCERYDIPPIAIEPHRKGYPTECPGKAFHDGLIDYIHEDIRLRWRRARPEAAGVPAGR